MFVHTKKFISEIEKRPCIWLISDSEYKKKNVTDNAWDEIGKVMYPKYSGEEFQNRVKETKKKWNNIRDCYRRYLKEQEDSQDPPAFKKRKYIYAEMLQFLNPVFKSKTPGDNHEDLNQKDEASVIYSTEECCQPPTPFPSKDKSSSTKALPSSMPPSSKVPQPSCISPSVSISPCSSMPLSFGTPSEACELKREKEKPTLRREFLEMVNSSQNVSNISTDEDADKAFLLSCLPDIRSFNEFQKIQFKRAVLDSIQNIKFPQSK